MVHFKRLIIVGLAAASLFVAQGSPPNPTVKSFHRTTMQRTGTFEVYKDRGGKFRWRLKASNGQVIATSGEGYSDKGSCMAGIDSVKRTAPTAKTKEM
jgi:uncharacterized protein